MRTVVETPAAAAVVADVVFPGQLNHHGTLFAGATLSLMSRAAFIAAGRTARRDVVLAECDHVEFLRPVYPGDVVEAHAIVVEVGERAMTVEVDVIVETLRTGERNCASRGRVLMVAVSDDQLTAVGR